MKISYTEHEELRAKYNPDGSDLRKAQQHILYMLKYLDGICKKNKITYWLDSGTLLGAIRHEGFIPWDEEADICMPLKDAEKFKKIMLSLKSEDFELQCHETDFFYLANSWYVFRDLKSEYIHKEIDNKDQCRKLRGLQIDIFVVEDSYYESLLYISRKYQSLIDWLLRKKFKWAKYFAFYLWFPFNKFIIPCFRCLSHNNHKKSYKMGYGNTFWSTRLVDNIYPLKKVVFEGIEFPAPNKSIEYLRDIYGDDLSLPPTDKIITHKVSFKFFDK